MYQLSKFNYSDICTLREGILNPNRSFSGIISSTKTDNIIPVLSEAKCHYQKLKPLTTFKSRYGWVSLMPECYSGKKISGDSNVDEFLDNLFYHDYTLLKDGNNPFFTEVEDLEMDSRKLVEESFINHCNNRKSFVTIGKSLNAISEISYNRLNREYGMREVILEADYKNMETLSKFDTGVDYLELKERIKALLNINHDMFLNTSISERVHLLNILLTQEVVTSSPQYIELGLNKLSGLYTDMINTPLFRSKRFKTAFKNTDNSLFLAPMLLSSLVLESNEVLEQIDSIYGISASKTFMPLSKKVINLGFYQNSEAHFKWMLDQMKTACEKGNVQYQKLKKPLEESLVSFSDARGTLHSSMSIDNWCKLLNMTEQKLDQQKTLRK